MRVVGITGGIGSGKSTVCRILEELGYPVYYADVRARQLMNSSQELINSIKTEFGRNMYKEGELDRVVLAEVVFNSPQKLELLNALVHPAVAKDFDQWKSEQQSSLVFKEAAILFESGANKGVDESVLVTAPEDVRVERVTKRDGVDSVAVKARMANQWSEARKRELANHEIINDFQTLILPQINALLKHWRE